MRVIFMGTAENAVPPLEALIKSKHEICLAISKTDKIQDEEIIIPTAVNLCANKHNIEIFQPEKLKTPKVIEKLTELAPDAIIVVAYGKVIPKEILDIPKHGCIKLHNSLLPKHRGASPIPWSIIKGDKVTGVTAMLLDEGQDTGDILMQSKTFIQEYETTKDLKNRLPIIGGELLIKTLDSLEAGTITPIKQNYEEATNAAPIEKLSGRIEWDKSAEKTHNLIRGANPYPIAHTTLNGQIFKIFKSKVVSHHLPTYPGKIASINPLIVGCRSKRDENDGTYRCLELIEVLLKGDIKMSGTDFARKYRLNTNVIFGRRTSRATARRHY